MERRIYYIARRRGPRQIRIQIKIFTKANERRSRSNARSFESGEWGRWGARGADMQRTELFEERPKDAT